MGSNGRQKNSRIIDLKSINQLDKNSTRAQRGRHCSQRFLAEKCDQEKVDENYSDIHAADANKAKLMLPDDWAVSFASTRSFMKVWDGGHPSIAYGRVRRLGPLSFVFAFVKYGVRSPRISLFPARPRIT